MKYLIILSLVVLAIPILSASAEPIFVYSEQITRLDDTLSVCYQVIDIKANPLKEAGLVLSLKGKDMQEKTATTDANGIATASFDITSKDTLILQISKVLGNNTYDSTQETKITVYDTGIVSEPKTKKITLAAKPKIKTTCIDQTQTQWEIWDQDEKTTTYFDLNTWTTVKTDKTKVVEITQAGKTVKANLPFGTWKKDIDSVLVKNGFAPTLNLGTIQKIAISESLKKSDPIKKIEKETKKEIKPVKETKKNQSKDTKTIKVLRGQTINEKISGTIPMDLYQKGKPADVSILHPNGKTEMQKITVSSKGKFEHPFSITDRTPPGKYEITISYSGTEVKKFTYEIKN